MTCVKMTLSFILRGKLICKCFNHSDSIFVISRIRRLCFGTNVKVINFDHCGNILSHFRNNYQVHQHLTQTSVRIYSENWNGACAEVVGVRVEMFRRCQRKGLHLCLDPGILFWNFFVVPRI